jgi:plastocyanin
MANRKWLTSTSSARTDLSGASLMMKHRPARIISLAFATLPLACLGQGTMEGTVQLPKTHFAPVENERYEIVSKAGVLATDPPRAVVYLEGSFPRSANLPTKTVGQKDLAFRPPLLAIEVGTKVEFPNQDDTYHNIFSYSPAKRFDLGRYPPEQNPPPSVLFDKPGLVTLRCDIHEHMRGLILVLATPYFAITDTQGHFRLTNLPAGHHLLKAWINSKTTLQQPVDLKSGARLQVHLP